MFKRLRIAWLGGLFLALVLPALTGAALALDGATLYEEKLQSVVYIQLYDEEGHATYSGSGFYIDSDKVATNFHVINANLRQTGDGANDFELVSPITVRILGTKEEVEVEDVLGFDPKLDVAVLEVGREAPPLVLGDHRKHSVGETVFVIGNPLGLDGTFSTGVISAFRRLGENKGDGGIPVIQFTADISFGSSGGPVFAEDGTVIGIATLGSIFFSGSFNFAVPVADIGEKGRNDRWWRPMETVRREEARAAAIARREAERREAQERRRKLMEERRQQYADRRAAPDAAGGADTQDAGGETETYRRYVVTIKATGGTLEATTVEEVAEPDGTEQVRVETATGAASYFAPDTVEITDRGPPPEPAASTGTDDDDVPGETGGETGPDPAADASAEDGAAPEAVGDGSPEAPAPAVAGRPTDDPAEPTAGSAAPDAGDAPPSQESARPGSSEMPEVIEAVEEETPPAYVVHVLATGGRLEAEAVAVVEEADGERIRVRTSRGMTVTFAPEDVAVYRPDGEGPLALEELR